MSQSRLIVKWLAVLLIAAAAVLTWELRRTVWSGKEGRSGHPVEADEETPTRVTQPPRQTTMRLPVITPNLTGSAVRATRIPQSSAERTAVARSEGQEWISQLTRGGRSTEAWTRDASRVISRLGHSAPDLSFRISETECRSDGCFARATFSSVDEYRSTRERIKQELIEDYPEGAKTITGPELQESGEVDSYLILRRPDRM
jgi:hypothetical protein